MSKIYVEDANGKIEYTNAIAISKKVVGDELESEVAMTDDIKKDDIGDLVIAMLGFIDSISDLDTYFYFYKEKFGKYK